LKRFANSSHYNIPKSSVLIPLSEALNINYTKFKNRRELIQEIQLQFPPSKRCENSKDFVTLCNIDDIPKKQLFLWSQNDKLYGADIISLKHYIDSGNTMNPWTIDFATGRDDALDREQYLNKYDMKRQNGLLRRINSAYTKFMNTCENSEKCQSPKEKISENEKRNILRFKIESLGDSVEQYVTHIINCFENCDLRLFLYVLSDALRICIEYFIINNDTVAASMLEQLFIKLEITKFQVQMNGLESSLCNIEILYHILQNFEREKDHLLYSNGIIKYIFMELEESLKNYKLLS
jgi:hypothetical protein